MESSSLVFSETHSRRSKSCSARGAKAGRETFSIVVRLCDEKCVTPHAAPTMDPAIAEIMLDSPPRETDKKAEKPSE